MHTGRSVAVNPSHQEKVKCWKGWLWSHTAEVLSCWVTHARPRPPSVSGPALCRPCSVVRARGRPGGGGGLFSLQFTNTWNYSERTHPQPESSWSKAYFEFIWCAIHYLLKMKKNDFYCTELLHIVIYLSAFCSKQTTKGDTRKMKKGRERTLKQKQPRATSVCLADGGLSLLTEVPVLPRMLCFWLLSIGMWPWHWDIRHLSFLITESLTHSKQHILW